MAWSISARHAHDSDASFPSAVDPSGSAVTILQCNYLPDCLSFARAVVQCTTELNFLPVKHSVALKPLRVIPHSGKYAHVRRKLDNQWIRAHRPEAKTRCFRRHRRRFDIANRPSCPHSGPGRGVSRLMLFASDAIPHSLTIQFPAVCPQALQWKSRENGTNLLGTDKHMNWKPRQSVYWVRTMPQ